MGWVTANSLANSPTERHSQQHNCMISARVGSATARAKVVASRACLEGFIDRHLYNTRVAKNVKGEANLVTLRSARRRQPLTRSGLETEFLLNLERYRLERQEDKPVKEENTECYAEQSAKSGDTS